MPIVEKAQLMSAPEIDRTLHRLAHEIVEKTGGTKHLALIGIRRRGVPIAQRIAQAMRGIDGVEVPVGILDITLYRDDLSKVAPQAVLQSSDIPFGVDDMDLVLLDDVLYTGRTIRAAMNGLFDLGRPRRIRLCVLIDRGHREMPIEAPFIGRTVHGADTMNRQAEASSPKKGESLLDTVQALNAMKPDALVMRHEASGAPEFVARHLDIPVVNAGDGTHEHPSQGLLDALTISDRKGTIENLNVTILGDILHSRVARSNIHLLGKFGCRFTLCGPPMWVPRELEKIAPGTPIRCVYRIEEALEGAHVIIMLRVQTERLNDPPLCANDYILLYQLNAERLRRANRDAIVLHPGPMNRGIEITPEVADGPQSCVLEQVTNGVAVRMAILYLLISGATETDTHPALEVKRKESANASD